MPLGGFVRQKFQMPRRQQDREMPFEHLQDILKDITLHLRSVIANSLVKLS